MSDICRDCDNDRMGSCHYCGHGTVNCGACGQEYSTRPTNTDEPSFCTNCKHPVHVPGNCSWFCGCRVGKNHS